MPRPAVATPADVRSAVLALLAQAGVGERPSPQSFRRAVSVRKVREQLGGGNPATISREINAVEAQIVQAGLANVALPDIPSDIAELMQQLWRAAVAAQLDEVAQLKAQAQAAIDGAREPLAESQLRVEMLKAELAELRGTLAERDRELAQARADHAALLERDAASRTEAQSALARVAQLQGEREALRKAQAEAVAAAQERYEGLSRRLLEETAQQRQAAQAEIARMTSQLKFADKREATLQARLQQLEADLADVRGAAQKSEGEVAALRYVNTSLRAQLDELVRALPSAPAAAPTGLARGRKRASTAKKEPARRPA